MIRKALHSDSANSFSELWPSAPILDVYEDFGDLQYDAFLHGASSDDEYEASHSSIRRAVWKILDSGKRPLILGGDHALSFPVVSALRSWRLQNTPENASFTIVHFDAHPDLYDSFEGNRFSHACPFARICELNLFGGEEVAAMGSNECHISLVQLAIRTHTAHSREQAQRFGVDVLEMKDWPETQRALASYLAKAILGGRDKADAVDAYVSFDMDALDPSCAPGVSHHEPGGLTTRQAMDALHALSSLRESSLVNFVGADIVEFNPSRDVNGVTAMTTAKIAKELMALLHGSTTLPLAHSVCHHS